MTKDSIHFRASSTAPVDLGNGLVMRWSTKDDTDNICSLVGASFKWMTFPGPVSEGVFPGPNELLIASVRRLMSGKNASMSEYDHAVVEDTQRRKQPGHENANPIVACAGLHRARAFYGCVPLFFGKPELIATDVEYRGQGLVRRLMMEMIHPESDARGDALLFIAGLPNFYRQYGYEYAISRFNPGKIANVDKFPGVGKDQQEPYRLRRATQEDLPFLLKMSAKERVDPHTEMGLAYGPEYWQYTVCDNTPENAMDKRFDGDRDTQVVVDSATGEDVGFTIVSHIKGLKLEALSLMNEKVFIGEAIYPIVRALIANEKKLQERRKAEELDPVAAEKIQTSGYPFVINLPLTHPARQNLAPVLEAPDTAPGYRLYARIPDYAKLIKQVQPELERRLAQSPMAGITGRLQLDFYRVVEGSNAKGLEIVFQKGHIVEVQHWVMPSHEKQLELFLKNQKEGLPKTRIFAAAFAPLTFTTLITGDRSLEELQLSYGENTCADESTRMLLNSLFPKVLHHMDTSFM
ncbi:hypothetical protein EMPS_01312 [Entomortierella parvispora]|uniref:N-acetyltransferase domain-containing protein n=1 Tax=Entomortierella parvispora TaxID=205924 RepID=A0A9P3LSF2_9FUNG|nr:hypothetical protein EMPS_01312 [Entomortierella parvispora]